MNKNKVPETPNFTLVAFYEKNEQNLKSDAFVQLLESIQKRIPEVLKEGGADDKTFKEYKRRQVHATILGCEGGKSSGRVLNKWFWEKRHQERYMDFDHLLRYFRWYSSLPIVVRFGGYMPDTNYGFTSQELHPFVRSFQIRNDKTAILMGWPYRAGHWPLSLDQLRLGAQKCNALHKFHGSLADVDNDCYLRVGYFTDLPKPELQQRIEKAVREILSGMAPIYEAIDHTTLALARYKETTLDLSQTDAWKLDDITAAAMPELYPEAENA
jgi:hypothetical protein